MFENIDALKTKLDQHRPLSPAIVKNLQEEPFSDWQIRNIHQLILKNIDDDNAGRYRQQNVLISGATTPPSRLYITK